MAPFPIYTERVESDLTEVAFIFDMDGIIIDSEPIYIEWNTEMLRERNLEVAPTTRAQFIGGSPNRKWRTIKEMHQLEESVEELIEYQTAFYSSKSWDYPKILIGTTISFIKQLYEMNVPMALASSSSQKKIKDVLQICDLEKYFKVTMSGEQFKESKPNPEIFLKTAKELGFDPKQCIVVEDSLNGLKAAKAAGMRVIARKHMQYEMDLTLADEIVNDLTEIQIEKWLKSE